MHVGRRTLRVLTVAVLSSALLPFTFAFSGSPVAARDGGQTIAASARGVVPDVDSGSGITCVLNAIGEVSCWGIGGAGRLGNGSSEAVLAPPEPLSLPGGATATAISAGQAHACALLDTGKIACWGWNNSGQVGDGTRQDRLDPVQVTLPGDATATAVSAGGDHTCALLSSGEVSCWGSNLVGQIGIGSNDDRHLSPQAPVALPGGALATSVAAGFGHTCAIRVTGELSCWGFNEEGQLGVTTAADIVNAPMPEFSMPGGVGVRSVSPGNRFTCAVHTTGEVSCWGDDRFGRLGNGDGGSGTSLTPIPLPPGAHAIDVDSGFNHACAHLVGGDVTCWGRGAEGAIGNGGTADVEVPTAPLALPDGSSAVALGTGWSHTCALLSGAEVACWGRGQSGEIGNGATENQLVPVMTSPVPSPSPQHRVIAIAAGFRHTCALLDDGAITCWGSDQFGQLGNREITGDQPTPGAPVVLPLGGRATAIAAGRDHTCAILDTGEVTCWGSGGDGRLGVGATGDRTSPSQPVALPGDARAIGITAGLAHTCALLETGEVSCWGSGNPAGGGSTTPSAPLALPGGATATAIAAGFGHTCVVLSTGGVSCWGDVPLGDGTNNSSATPIGPISFPGGAEAVALSGGLTQACALLDDRSASCWGRSDGGQLGNGTAPNFTGAPASPALLHAGRRATAIATGDHTCAILDGGDVTCWGNGAFGARGDGTNTFAQSTPVGPIALPGGHGAVAVTAGERHTCALLDTAQVACWGAGADGQLGHGDTPATRNTPVLVEFPVAQPTVELEPDQASPTNDAVVDLVVRIDQPAPGFNADDITIGGTAGATTAAVTHDYVVTDRWFVDVSGMTQSGTVEVTIPEGDVSAYGNVASNTLVIDVDLDGPVLSLPDDIAVDTEPDEPDAVVTFEATATDPDSAGAAGASFGGNVDVTCDPASGSRFPIGTTAVTCAATDTIGNTSTGSFTVTVDAVTSPATTTTTTTVPPTTQPPATQPPATAPPPTSPPPPPAPEPDMNTELPATGTDTTRTLLSLAAVTLTLGLGAVRLTRRHP